MNKTSHSHDPDHKLLLQVAVQECYCRSANSTQLDSNLHEGISHYEELS